MQQPTDAELLRDYAANHSEAAFSEIVRRYADSIYSAAWRQVGDAAQARDVAQSVFVDLARKAATLSADTVLIGWLHRGTRLAVLELQRKEQRRQLRERQAMELYDPHTEPAPWNAVRPVLDEAIAFLGEEDRDALLLRFFKNESLAAVGAMLGVSEDAAQKRVSRALAKLRDFLAQRGIRTTASALSVALTTNAVQSAPHGFAAVLSAAALTKASLAGSAASPMLNLFACSAMKTALLSLAVAGGIAGIIAIHAQSEHRLKAARILIEEQAMELASLRAANKQLPALTNELDRWRDEARDVLRLRALVTRQQRELAAAGTATANPANPGAESQIQGDPDLPQVNIKTTFIIAPGNPDSRSASLQSPVNSTGGSMIGLLSEAETASIRENLHDEKIGVELGSPQITTLSGREVELAMTSSGTVGDVSTNIGIWFDVEPTYLKTASAVVLDFRVKVSGLVDVSAEQNGSQFALQTLSFTNHLEAPEGQTVCVSARVPAGTRLNQEELSDSSALPTKPRTLLLLITPTLIDSAGNRILVRETNSTQPMVSSGQTAPIFPTPISSQPPGSQVDPSSQPPISSHH